MEIGGLQKVTLIDYPGKVACTVFLIGCNFRCPFCYSGEFVLPKEIKKQPRILEKDFFDFLKQRKELLDAVVICGGEPTIYYDLPLFCKKIKKLGYLVKLDTNGSNPKMIEKLIKEKLIDYVAMDVKAPISKYEEMAGVKVNLENIKKSVEILQQGKLDFEFRTTVAPDLTKQDILKIADWIKNKNTKYFLQEFNNQKPVLNPKILKFPILKKEEIEEIIKKIKQKFQTCQLR